MYGLKIDKIDGELCLHLDKSVTASGSTLFNMLQSWQAQSAKLEAVEITREEYDEWRYKYPELETSHHFAKVIPKGISDMLIAAMKEKEAQEKKKAKKERRNEHKNNLTDFHCLKISKVPLCHIKIKLFFELESNVAKSLPKPKQICLETA